MKARRRICIVTGTRAEYGLLYWLMKAIEEDETLELQIVATGMHLSPEFGMTVNTIEHDGFRINKRIEMLLSSDTSVGISKSMGLGLISFGEAFEALNPDIIVLLGDRFEAFAAAAAATVCRIPIAHIHGGETTEGLIDEPIRHSITKMAHVHFTATEKYRTRVIQLGESPSRVFNVGTPGLDNIYNLNLLSEKELEKAINFKLNKKNILVTFHPVTLEKNTAQKQFSALLEAIDELENTNIIFTKPNADTEGRIIIEMIDKYVTANAHKACSFASLGTVRYLSTLQYVDIVLGNSSSGLIEAPSFNIATVNIGDRQKGRIKARSVIDCDPTYSDISKALTFAFSDLFRQQLKNVSNPYGYGGASIKIKSFLKDVDLKDVLKKKFHDLNFIV